MFFIFGWGRGTGKDLGPTLPVNCPNCHNDTVWHLYEQKRWFTLFFIPVIPYESNSFFICPICSRGVELNGERLEQARRLNNAAQSFRAGTMSESEFNAELTGANKAVPLLLAQVDSESAQLSAGMQPVTYCPSCDFQSFNAVATHCPTCREPLVAWPQGQHQSS